MKIARVKTPQGSVCYAQVVDDECQLISSTPFDGIELTGESVALSDCRLLAPVTPSQVVAIGLNYRQHAAEGNANVPDAPLVFIKTPNTVIGPGDPICLPQMAPDEVDYECELVVVIGKQAKNVSEQEADGYILGFTCGNDVSARDCQMRYDRQWARAKCFDTFAPMGPWIETELDAGNTGIRTVLNGKTVQDSTTADMIFPYRQLVSYVSRCMTLYPGSVIMTGTPSGVGFARRPPLWLQDGDEVTIHIDGIGKLTNPVCRE